MNITHDSNNTAILKEIGTRIKRNRIDMQISQSDFAQRAGISTRTLSAAENGGDIRIETLLRILRVMGHLENLELLLPEMAYNPEDFRVLKKERERASKKTTTDNSNTSEWKWGDEN